MLNPVPDPPAAPPPDALPWVDAPSAGTPPALDQPTAVPLTRGRAIAETVCCSSYPTQIAAAAVMAMAGVPAQDAAGGLNAAFVFGVSALDAVLVVGLIVYLLRRRRESLAAVFLGDRRPWREAVFGVTLVPLVTLGVAGLVLATRMLVPALHNVAVNPLTSLMSEPLMAAAFAVVVVLAGGVREEMQRAFQLHRLSRHVCPPLVALAITSVAFGLGHTVQGRDVALATFGLGVFWGALYLRRQSLVAAAVSHGLFNLGQVAIGLAASRVAAP